MAAPAAVSAVMVPSDLVGYGKWGELTYQQVWDQEPEYCLWTLNKFQELVKEGEELATPFVVGDSKMKRLTQWIKETDDLRAAVEPEFECDSDMEQVEIENPETETLAKRCAKLRAEKEGMSSKFYGVASPEEHAGVYSSWTECKPHVFGIKGVMYKSFGSEEEAEEYVRNPPARKLSPLQTPEAIAAREQARVAKEEAKAAKAVELQAAKAAKEEEKQAKAAEAKAAKEKAKAETKANKGKKRPAAPESSAEAKPSEEKPKAKRAKETKASKTDVLNRAEELGLTRALQNLSSRAEIISKGLSSEALLDALVKADGLVNKAKSALLSSEPATSDPASPSTDARMDRLDSQISPEKHEQEKQEKNDELAKTLKNLSSTLLLLTTPARKEEVQTTAPTQADLTDMQTQRIKENRERALARRAQVSK